MRVKTDRFTVIEGAVDISGSDSAPEVPSKHTPGSLLHCVVNGEKLNRLLRGTMQ